MSMNKRNEFFAAIIAGYAANPHLKGELADDVIRKVWSLADMAVYHENRVESPKQRAKRWIRKNYVIVDTETTGLGRDARIVEIAIIDCMGRTLLNTLVKPMCEIPAEATAIHGITNEMVADAPIWAELMPEVSELIGDRWIAYNAQFDDRMIEQSSSHIPECDFPILLGSPECAMELYAEFNGEWDDYRRKYKWKKLAEAAKALGVPPVNGAPHRALCDCQLTLGVIRAIAEVSND
ncbi:3'-5' exonuclease [Kluyvera sp. STS39-E]|uniref:3'-5' exonuclease n=1 Tax=Kluyvera sp. STS39-E TaxID=3234748 RepID=UPI0034C6AAE0